MMVLDASICAPWFLLDEEDASSRAVARRVEAEGALVPAIWMFEIRNILLVAERRGRLGQEDAQKALGALERLPLTLDGAPNHPVIYSLATAHLLSFYDAAYLELAFRHGAILATLDRRLKQAAEARGLAVIA